MTETVVGSLTADDIRRGLRELNSGFSFDAVLNRPSEYRFVLQGDNKTSTRGGVFHNGHFICAMDRGVIPEHTVWSEKDGFEEIRMCDIERYDETRVVYVEILEDDPFYNEALLKAERGDDNYRLDDDGKVFRYQALRECKVPDQVGTIGWRATLSKIASLGLPGVAPVDVEVKFGVRL